jgi:hypothetical protein
LRKRIENLHFKRAETNVDFRAVLSLRKRVYSDEEKRITTPEEFSDSFDKYNDKSVYFVGYCGEEPIGTVKVIRDSPIGLPCGDVINLAALRKDSNVLVEFGHLIVLPRYREKDVFLLLAREAFRYGRFEVNATHIIGDVFIDKGGHNYTQDFYHKLGFTDLHGPYKDSRFSNSPDSMLIVLDLAEIPKNIALAKGTKGRLMKFFMDS